METEIKQDAEKRRLMRIYDIYSCPSCTLYELDWDKDSRPQKNGWCHAEKEKEEVLECKIFGLEIVPPWCENRIQGKPRRAKKPTTARAKKAPRKNKKHTQPVLFKDGA